MFSCRGRLKKRGPHDKAYNPEKLQEINVRRPYPFLCGVISNQQHFQPRSQPPEVQRHVASLFGHLPHLTDAVTFPPPPAVHSAGNFHRLTTDPAHSLAQHQPPAATEDARRPDCEYQRHSLPHSDVVMRYNDPINSSFSATSAPAMTFNPAWHAYPH